MVRVEEDEVEGDLELDIPWQSSRSRDGSGQMPTYSVVDLDGREAAEGGVGPDVGIVNEGDGEPAFEVLEAPGPKRAQAQAVLERPEEAIDEPALDLIGESIASETVDSFVARCKKA